MGGRLNSFYTDVWEMDLWEIVDLIEIIAEANKDPNEVDLWDILTAE